MPRFNLVHAIPATLPAALVAVAFMLVIDLTPLAAWQSQANQPQQTTAQNQQQQQTEASNIVAVVNGQQITRDQLSLEAASRFGETVIESIINNHLITVRCQQEGIAVTEQDIETELDRRARKFRMTIKDYVALICGERNLTEYKLRNEIIWTDIALRRLASSLTQVSDAEIDKQLDSEFGPKVQVRAIAVEDADQARVLLAQAKANPEQFSRLAINHSVDPNSASVGGLLPPLHRNMDEKALEEVAFGLQVGGISEVMQLANQFVFLKCERHYPGTELGDEDRLLARQRIRDEIKDSKLGAAAETLFREMQESAQIQNIHNNPELKKQMPGVAATVNGQQITMEMVYDECLTRFGTEVLQSQINRTLIMQRLQQVGDSVAQDDLNKEIGRAAIEFGMKTAEGQADTEKWINYVTKGDRSRVEIYMQDEVWPTVAMKKIVAREVQVTDEDMQKGFEANFGPRVEVLAIVLQDQRKAQTVWEMAKANQTEKYFGDLAHEYSIEGASRAHYGEVPPIQMHGGRKVLEEEAFRLQPGEISGLIPVGQSWLILWCKGRTTPVVEEFDAVKDELYKNIMEKKLRIAMAEEFERLTQSAQIDNFMIGSSQPGAQLIQAARQSQQPAPSTNR